MREIISAVALSSRKPSSLLDTRLIYCGDNLDQLKKLPDACVDLIYIDPPFNSNRNYEVFWGRQKKNGPLRIGTNPRKPISSSCVRAA